MVEVDLMISSAISGLDDVNKIVYKAEYPLAVSDKQATLLLQCYLNTSKVGYRQHCRYCRRGYKNTLAKQPSAMQKSRAKKKGQLKGKMHQNILQQEYCVWLVVPPPPPFSPFPIQVLMELQGVMVQIRMKAVAAAVKMMSNLKTVKVLRSLYCHHACHHACFATMYVPHASTHIRVQSEGYLPRR